MPKKQRAGRRSVPSSESVAAFGPSFFLGQLRAFARESCPDPAEQLPEVEVHLATGEGLELCHVIGLAPGYVALAVREKGRTASGMRMRTELLPYSMIVRITIRAPGEEGSQVGFNLDHAPKLLGISVGRGRSPEAMLRRAATPSPRVRGATA